MDYYGSFVCGCYFDCVSDIRETYLNNQGQYIVRNIKLNCPQQNLHLIYWDNRKVTSFKNSHINRIKVLSTDFYFCLILVRSHVVINS